MWTHILHVMDAFASERVGEEWEDLVVGFACLCHDLGKPQTTEFEGDRIRSKGHDREGEAPTRARGRPVTPSADPQRVLFQRPLVAAGTGSRSVFVPLHTLKRPFIALKRPFISLKRQRMDCEP